ncbi:hypothetical protein HMF8227_00745 [Saliniradius amylolyticus]|uniref:Nitroreductase domain-containing protein n=1 Tax=Saliniradius amylolyticus TaxID=2183582 RepID=A0A2S2E0R7_9ALTE|nr:nitroreductase family protein [Saliniradius amylolyticus]AWL11241.1 hypothetical protein HMF8227_00745 [Saliniradius amylolyticus]
MFKALIRKVLPRSAIVSLKKNREDVRLLLLSLFAKSPFLSSLYYTLVSREFRREQHAVLNGRLTYYKTHQSLANTASSALLRRNTHRLEKGLIMRPRRPVFAEQYIQETVEAFAKMVNSRTSCEQELKWATDVLTDYFDVVEPTAVVTSARNVFEATGRRGDSGYVPYTDSDRSRSQIDDLQLELLFRQRRSTRWFRQSSVEDDKLDRAIQLASWAPSACNRQPFRFFVANGNEKAQQIAELAVGTGGFVHNIPCTIAVVGELSAYPLERDRHLIYIDGSLAAMQLMLALETLGLASCPLNWPDIDFREKAIAERLELAPEQRVVMLIAIGYAEHTGKIPYSQKKTVESLRQDVK